MHHGLHDAALLERHVVLQFHRIQHRAGRDAGLTHRLHRRALVAGFGPGGDDRVHFRFTSNAVGGRGIAGVADQVLAAHQLQQPVPMFRVGARGHNKHVIVRPSGRAGIQPHRRVVHTRHLRPAAFGRLAGQALGREVDAHVVHDRVLHRDLEAVALPGFTPLIKRAQDGDRHQHPGTGVAEREAGPDRRAIGLPGDAERAAGGLCDHVEREVLLERAAFAEPFDLGIDDAGVDGFHHVVAQPQPLDGTRREILDRDVGLAQQVLHQFQSLGGLQVDGDGTLVGVEHVEIIRIVVRLPRPQAATRVAHAGVLDLHHIGAQPRQRFRAGRTSLELGEIDDFHAGEEFEIGDDIGHGACSHRLTRCWHKMLGPAKCWRAMRTLQWSARGLSSKRGGRR